MNIFKALISYDGTDYFGWQEQPDKVAVVNMLKSRFKQVFGQDVRIVGSSRTDAGVHALGQVARIETDFAIQVDSLLQAWNGRLPQDIHIRSIIPAADNFHPQHNVRQKTYYYHFFDKRPLPVVARFGVYWHLPLDVQKLQESLSLFVGTHDFRSFCTGDEQENTIRTIDTIEYRYIPHYKVHRIIVRGPGFLRYMIRRIVGASLHVASYKKLNPEILYAALAAKNPLQQLPTAPAHGLLLRKITFHESF